jgi:LysM repeat protein
MKRISFLIMIALLAVPLVLPAQDAATEERLNKLSAQIDVLIEAKDAQNKRIEELSKQLRDVQEQVSKPSGNYASADDVQKLADAIKEVDKKRKDDNEKVVQELQTLVKSVSSGGGRKSGSTVTSTTSSTSNGPEKGYEYVVQQGDTLGAIVKAYRDKSIKVTIQQIMNANPGLKPEAMKTGQKIFIPASGQ